MDHGPLNLRDDQSLIGSSIRALNSERVKSTSMRTEDEDYYYS